MTARNEDDSRTKMDSAAILYYPLIVPPTFEAIEELDPVGLGETLCRELEEDFADKTTFSFRDPRTQPP